MHTADGQFALAIAAASSSFSLFFKWALSKMVSGKQVLRVGSEGVDLSKGSWICQLWTSLAVISEIWFLKSDFWIPISDIRVLKSDFWNLIFEIWFQK